MHKAKKAVNELKAYLGRDAAGLKLLGVVSDCVNDLRKEARLNAERADRMATVAGGRTQERKRAFQETQELEKSLAQQKQMNAQLQRELAQAQAKVDELEAEIEAFLPEEHGEVSVTLDKKALKGCLRENISVGLVDVGKLRKAFRALVRELKACPLQDLNGMDFKPRRYELSDIIDGYGTQDMINLGRFVSILAVYNMPCIISSRAVVRVNKEGSKREVLKAERQLYGPFLDWFRFNIHEGSEKAREIQDRLMIGERVALNELKNGPTPKV